MRSDRSVSTYTIRTLTYSLRASSVFIVSLLLPCLDSIYSRSKRNPTELTDLKLIDLFFVAVRLITGFSVVCRVISLTSAVTDTFHE